MDKFGNNGHSTALAQYETPFADMAAVKEFAETDQYIPADNFFSNYSKEVESPFSRSYEATAPNGLSPAGEDYVDLLAELNDSEFQETLYELANEVEDTWRNKVSNELAMGENYLPFASQQARDYFAPVIREAETMIDRVTQHFSGNNLADHSEASVESFFETLEYDGENFTPAQDQFFGKVFNKVKSVVKKGVALAKKGVAAVGKLMPLNIVLNKIKGLVRPLLDKVLKFAIGKLPKNLQPHAQTLANKFLKLETETPFTSNETAETGDDLEAVQTELDNYIAQLVFSDNETDAESTVINYESSDETLDRLNNYETGYVNTPSLDAARQQFVEDLKNLREGESPAPAIERFLPAAILALQPVIKIAIGLIGRQKVINFLAGLLAKLVSKYVPENVAKPLAASIIDVGMSAIGFEVHETNKADLAYEAIANTIQETVQNMTNLNEADLNNTEALSMSLLEAFEQAAASNFPSQYIREEVRQTNHRAVWVAMPRNMPVKFYKKFTHPFDITIDPQTAATVTTFRNLPLANFLKDKYGLDASKPVKAKVHLFEINKGGRLSMISKFERLPGLNARQPKAWVQLLPLTKQAAALLLKEPRLGKDLPPKNTTNRFKTAPGQRFYFLEIDGAKLRLPPVSGPKHKRDATGQPVAPKESHSADTQGIINFIKSEIKLNYFFSEEDAKDVVGKLNTNDFLGAAMSLKKAIKTILNDVLSKNVSTKVKIVHEAIPDLYLAHEDSITNNLAKMAGNGLLSTVIQKIIDTVGEGAYKEVVKFFKERANEFKQAQALPQDGVTVKISWTNVPGMSAVKKLISVIKGDQAIGNLSDLSMPGLPAPEIKIVAGKQFD